MPIIPLWMIEHNYLYHDQAADWLFFEASRGNRPYDGGGDVTKKRADDVINRKQVTVIAAQIIFYSGSERYL